MSVRGRYKKEINCLKTFTRVARFFGKKKKTSSDQSFRFVLGEIYRVDIKTKMIAHVSRRTEQVQNLRQKILQVL